MARLGRALLEGRATGREMSGSSGSQGRLCRLAHTHLLLQAAPGAQLLRPRALEGLHQAPAGAGLLQVAPGHRAPPQGAGLHVEFMGLHKG